MNGKKKKKKKKGKQWMDVASFLFLEKGRKDPKFKSVN
jgi:hypothetical protein